MRTEGAGLRTWWLASFAGWALLLCVMAALGLGSRLQALPDAANPRPLPALPAAAPERVGDFARYQAIADRPVFAQDRRPHPFLLGGDEEGPAAEGLRLTGVLITPRFQMATLTTDQGRSLRLRLQGEAVEGWQLIALQPRSATVAGPGGPRSLELQVFNGQGGTPPTVLRAPGGGAAPPAGGTASAAGMAAPMPGRVAAPPGATNVPRPAAMPDAAAGANAPSQAQMEQIRQRIEARRRALQQQNAAQDSGAPKNGQNP